MVKNCQLRANSPLEMIRTRPSEVDCACFNSNSTPSKGTDGLYLKRARVDSYTPNNFGRMVTLKDVCEPGASSSMVCDIIPSSSTASKVSKLCDIENTSRKKDKEDVEVVEEEEEEKIR